MVSVRPNDRVGASRAVARRLGVVVLLAAVACSSGARDGAPSDTAAATGSAPASAPASAPSPYVAEIPAWPADTTASAADRDGRLPAHLAAKVPSCGPATPVVTPDSVGPLYPGQPLANLFGACPHLLQLWHYDDGKYLPAIAVKLGGATLLLDASGVTPDAVVTRVAALSGARTTEGIGPGSPLAEVSRAYGAPTWRRQQCAVNAAFAARPGIVIHVTPGGKGGDYTCEDIRRLATGSDFTRFPRASTVGWIAAELDAEP